MKKRKLRIELSTLMEDILADPEREWGKLELMHRLKAHDGSFHGELAKLRRIIRKHSDNSKLKHFYYDGDNKKYCLITTLRGRAKVFGAMISRMVGMAISAQEVDETIISGDGIALESNLNSLKQLEEKAARVLREWYTLKQKENKDGKNNKPK